jgi:hypothetical protein
MDLRWILVSQYRSVLGSANTVPMIGYGRTGWLLPVDAPSPLVRLVRFPD